jgi:hypothetical protein
MSRHRTGSILVAGAMAIAALLPHIALAQTNSKPNNQSGSAAGTGADRQNCEAPADPSRKGDRVPQADGDLSRKLDNCNGVLEAPQSGDAGMVAPAPDTGNSRVIKPGDVPQNANPSNGSGG